MKKYLALLLCLMMILSLFACNTTDKNKDTENDTANTESLEKDDGTKDTSISDINKQYYKIEKIDDVTRQFFISDSYFSRMFKQYAGVSPNEYKKKLKTLLGYKFRQ